MICLNLFCFAYFSFFLFVFACLLVGPYRFLLGLTGPHWAPPGLTGHYRSLLVLTVLYWSLQVLLLVFIVCEADLYILMLYVTHLSPGVSLIYDLVHDSGILQSELFTSSSQILVLAKLPIRVFGDMANFSSEIG